VKRTYPDLLNVKKLRLKSFATHPVQLKLMKSGAGASPPLTFRNPPMWSRERQSPADDA